MKNLYFYCFTVLFIFSCSSEDQDNLKEDSSENFNQSLEDLQEEIVGPVWAVQSDSNYFEIDIPTQMEYMDHLNPEANLEYGFTERIDGEVKENYIIVMVEPFPEGQVKKEEIKLKEFAEAYIDSLMIGKDSYEILNEPVEESINGMKAYNFELSATMLVKENTKVDIYYRLGVFLGEKALYQVLSWTLMSQKDNFNGDMKRMIYSFKEI
ncbi:hypothetical protein K6119_18085 [Paracrocinitomix mangrovi]|uniref:hypothetical protein n=1 Tax=Paracrocinitomix mangrovi TaxID=2862509 RepID=UPI001C8DC104|nr:hypothetical protein [Paracrocinitomix mangrovi]UKN01635.1 hypothetical protein K6119_18085 [Paracrocinitomix mangrovi]